MLSCHVYPKFSPSDHRVCLNQTPPHPHMSLTPSACQRPISSLPSSCSFAEETLTPWGPLYPCNDGRLVIIVHYTCSLSCCKVQMIWSLVRANLSVSQNWQSGGKKRLNRPLRWPCCLSLHCDVALLKQLHALFRYTGTELSLGSRLCQHQIMGKHL